MIPCHASQRKWFFFSYDNIEENNSLPTFVFTFIYHRMIWNNHIDANWQVCQRVTINANTKNIFKCVYSCSFSKHKFCSKFHVWIKLHVWSGWWYVTKQEERPKYKCNEVEQNVFGSLLPKWACENIFILCWYDRRVL